MKEKLQLRFLGLTAGIVSLIAGAGLYGAADSNLTSALTSVTTYFSANIGAVVAAVVGIVVFVWLLKIALHSFGIRKPGRGIV